MASLHRYAGNQANALQVIVNGSLCLWFSYNVLVAFQTPATGLVVCQNKWSTTTGRHLTQIDGGNRQARVPFEEFQRLWSSVSRRIDVGMSLCSFERLCLD